MVPAGFVPRALVNELLRSRPADPELLAELRAAGRDIDDAGRDRAERLFGP